MTGYDRPSPDVFYACLVTVAAWIFHLSLRQVLGPDHPARLVATLLLVLSAVVLVVAELRLFRRLDDRQKRIQLHAMAIAFPSSLVALLGLGFLRATGSLPQGDLRDVAGVMLLTYLIGLLVAWWRHA